jgi:AraC-like DNA-binding protein
VDALSGFLDGPRARTAFLVKVVLEPPWALRIEDGAPLAVVAPTRGRAWLVHDASKEPLELAAGDVALVRGPDHYVVAHRSDAGPTIVIDPGGRCRTLDGESLIDTMDLGVRTWGNRADGRDVMLVGTYQTDGEVSRWLLDALPPVLVVRAHEWDSPVVPLLATEIEKEEPGQQVVLDRLLDLLLVTALRVAFASASTDVPAWFRANADPVIGRILRLMQNEPTQPWTVGSLAAEVGVSRALLARRFHELVGEPPMTFLTSWRLALAADLLLATDATIGAIARDVGYGSPFTFSTAFKRAYGVSPKAHRDAHADSLTASTNPQTATVVAPVSPAP